MEHAVLVFPMQISGNSIWDVSGTRRCSFPDAIFRKIHLKRKWNTPFWFFPMQISGNSIWKVNVTSYFGSSRWKLYGINGSSEEVVCLFTFGKSNCKFPIICVPFAHFYQFQAINKFVVTVKCFAGQKGGRKFWK